MKLEHQVAIVTGASRGIGAAIAKRFADEGAHVVICYNKNEKAAEAVLKAIGTDRATLAQADLTDETAVKRVVAMAHNISGRIDVLVNNAGAILRPGDWQCDVKTWQATMDANLTSAWLMIKHVAPHMRKAGKGSILNISSVYGELRGTGTGIHCRQGRSAHPYQSLRQRTGTRSAGQRHLAQ